MSEAKSIEDMAQTMKAAAIEEMKAELEAAGINPYTAYMAWETASKEAQVKAIRANYEKYQREKRYAELEAGIEKLQARVAKVERELDSLRGDGK